MKNKMYKRKMNFRPCRSAVRPRHAVQVYAMPLFRCTCCTCRRCTSHVRQRCSTIDDVRCHVLSCTVSREKNHNLTSRSPSMYVTMYPPAAAGKRAAQHRSTAWMYEKIDGARARSRRAARRAQQHGHVLSCAFTPSMYLMYRQKPTADIFPVPKRCTKMDKIPEKDRHHCTEHITIDVPACTKKRYVQAKDSKRWRAGRNGISLSTLIYPSTNTTNTTTSKDNVYHKNTGMELSSVLQIRNMYKYTGCPSLQDVMYKNVTIGQLSHNTVFVISFFSVSFLFFFL